MKLEADSKEKNREHGNEGAEQHELKMIKILEFSCFYGYIS
jgi:hypothetical protein